MDDPPQARMSQAPTLPSMQFTEASEGAEPRLGEVSAVLSTAAAVMLIHDLLNCILLKGFHLTS